MRKEVKVGTEDNPEAIAISTRASIYVSASLSTLTGKARERTGHLRASVKSAQALSSKVTIRELPDSLTLSRFQGACV